MLLIVFYKIVSRLLTDVVATLSTTPKSERLLSIKNIAKGTTDPRVEFISQDHSSQFTNLEHMYYNFRISNKC